MSLDAANVCRWISQMDDLSKELYWLLHLLAGHPPRASEAGVSRSEVPPEGGERNVYVLGPIVALLYGYNKSGSSNRIVRVPDSFTAAVLKLVLLFLRPIYWELHRVLREAGIFEPISEVEDARRRSFLVILRGQPVKDSDFTELLKSGFHRHLGVPLCTLGWRHWDAELNREFLAPEIYHTLEGTPIPDERSDAHARQFGHNPRTNRETYARNGGPPELHSFALMRACSFERLVKVFLIDVPASTAPQAAAAGEPPHATPQPSAAPVQALPASQHAPPTALVQAPPPAAPALPTAAPLVLPLRLALSTPQQVAAIKVLSLALHPAHRRVFKDPVLGEAVYYAITTSHSMLVVTATGSGKSAVILALGAHNSTQGKWTIVTVPLKALKDDLLRRAKELRLTAYAWEDIAQSQGWSAPSGIIFITPEKCTQRNFRAFFALKAQEDLLGHVIHDEAHYRITWASFR
jgi:hypothetical protein